MENLGRDLRQQPRYYSISDGGTINITPLQLADQVWEFQRNLIISSGWIARRDKPARSREKIIAEAHRSR